jgi:hypothetical protein
MIVYRERLDLQAIHAASPEHQNRAKLVEQFSQGVYDQLVALDSLLDATPTASKRARTELSKKAGGRYRFISITDRIVLYQPNGACQGFLFTAPHTLLLKRDGKPDHKREIYTSKLAFHFAKLSGGVALTWAAAENDRITDKTGADPSNRDPNYLADDEAKDMLSNPWLFAMNTCQMNFPDSKLSVHFDIHGMKDSYGADVCIGYAALARNQDWDHSQVARFEASIRDKMNGFLKESGYHDVALNLTPSGVSLSGDWGVASKRCTLTQVSTDKTLFLNERYFRQAIQVELSARFRKNLYESEPLRNKFVKCIQEIEFS